MMNRSNSAEDYVPSMMSFAGLEGSSQKHHLWDWETSSHSLNATVPATNNAPTSLQNQPFFPLDCPPPPLFPMNNFPFYSPPPVPEYPVGLIKQEDGLGGGGGRIGLNLGQRTYFSSGDGLDMDSFFARSRGVYSLSHQQQLPRCQAEGCKADLSGAKHYHRRHKVCEFHSKATVVIAHGLQQRFCQQCSRFHVLAEFDEAKRSCRKRLADHNRRRRKPQLPTTPTTTGTPESSSSSMIATASSTEKSNQAQESTQDITTTKTTTPVCVTSISTKGNHARNGPALSLGGVGAGERRGSMVCYTMHQGQGVFGAINVGGQGLTSTSSAAAAAKPPPPFQNPAAPSFFHHHNTLSSDSNEAPHSMGGASSHTTQHHQSNLHHLGQAMLELDFM